MPFLIGVLILTAVISGTVAEQAKGALPNNLLYPVKIDVDEKIEMWAAQGDVAKTQVAIALAQTRLNEAQALAKKGDLDTASQSIVTQNFDLYIQDASTTLSSLETQGDYHDAIALENQLQKMLADEVQVLEDASSQGAVQQQVSLVPILVETRKMLATASTANIAASTKAATLNLNDLKGL
jgi:uncharacterized protein (DUF885 family)